MAQKNVKKIIYYRPHYSEKTLNVSVYLILVLISAWLSCLSIFHYSQWKVGEDIYNRFELKYGETQEKIKESKLRKKYNSLYRQHLKAKGIIEKLRFKLHKTKKIGTRQRG